MKPAAPPMVMLLVCVSIVTVVFCTVRMGRLVMARLLPAACRTALTGMLR